MGGYYISSTPAGRRTPYGLDGEREKHHCKADSTGQENACCKAPPGTTADSYSTTVATLTILPGWWRYSPLSAQVFECRYPFECAGGTALNESYGLEANASNLLMPPSECEEGYEAPMCR